MSPEIKEKIEISFAAQAMMNTIGARIEDLAPDHVTLTSDIPTTCTQQHGFGHAGLTFSLGDSAAGYAALSVMPPEAEVLTTEMKINLLAPARGSGLRAVGRVIKPGRRLVIAQADVYALDENGTETHIALLTGTMFPVMP
ncbi:MAG: PaaI family thioesterase [Rhodobacteraceae bacterium]|nr:PaaI family thioesterase [Paracoccaceae bacterium]